MREIGYFQKCGEWNHWIPHPLPPVNPPLDLRAESLMHYGEASFALGQLYEACLQTSLPEATLKGMIYKEACFSGSIEGQASTLLDLFLWEYEKGQEKQKQEKRNKRDQKKDHPDQNQREQLTDKPSSDLHDLASIKALFQYSEAIQQGVKLLRAQPHLKNFVPILRAYEVLKSGSSYRQQSGSKEGWVPPPATHVPGLMEALEKYLYQPSKMPPLVRLGLAQAQWALIRPFEEAHGHMSRLFLLLGLMQHGLVLSPVFLPSVFLKKQALEYHEYLYRVRTRGDFESWIRFFLQGVKNQAQSSLKSLQILQSLRKELEEQVRTDSCFHKMRDTAQSVLDFLWIHPVTDVGEISRSLKKAYNTVDHALQIWKEKERVSERIQKRQRLYFFTAYLHLLESCE